ncbi:hypothetical protein F4818DRAFT_454406 [Hypoxylon cercidicola]|nr:hypothetical protein F4818DRAFT_454406 [Hypoxylon cercidicola]
MFSLVQGRDGMLAPPSLVERQDAAASYSSSSTTALSTGAIAGIAVGGAALLFAALAPLLIKLAKRQDHRRAQAAASSEGMMASLESGDVIDIDGHEAERPRRLRKKSVVSDRAAVIIDKEDDVGREESHSRHSSLQHASPARTRAGSSFTGNESGRSSAETQGGQQQQQQRSPEKQRGYGLYEHRRTASWIDEDAIHGPTVTSPQKQKQKQKQKRQFSWLGGGGGSLGRSPSDTTERMGSPTLPYTETDGKQKHDTDIESPGERDGRDSGSQSAHSSRYALAPRLSQPQPQLVYSSPQKPYMPISLPNPGSGSNNIAKSPPDIIQNPWFRNRVSFQAAHQLAGGARLPAPISIPQMPTQRKPILKHSTTDTDLTEILRMTAERLQDGHRSARRQTLMVTYGSGRLANEGSQSYHGGGHMHISYEPSSGEVSPVKSHKSAPATLAYAELEGCPPKSVSPQRQMQTPRHSRQISQLSAISMISEPDSLVASKRESVQEVRTALSSPSRVAKSTEPSPSPQEASEQQARPHSYGSSMSSALSTLYSMEEASVRSPPTDNLNFNDPVHTPRRATDKKLSAALDIFHGHQNPDSDGEISPRSRFRFEQEDEEDDKPAPLTIRRGTLGGRLAGTSSQPASPSKAEPVPPTNRLSFPAYAMYGNDDPFTAVPSPQNPARLSKVFSPLPVELPRDGDDDDDISDIKQQLSRRPAGARPMSQASGRPPIETPTPSPSRRRAALAMPSPRTILNSPTPRYNTNRPGSPVVSEAGLSSVYDSYTYSHSEADRAASPEDLEEEEKEDDTPDTTPTLGSSSAATPPTAFTTSPARKHARINSSGSRDNAAPAAPARRGSRRSPRVAFRTPNYAQPQQRLASDGSVYSQDQTGSASSNDYDHDHDYDQVPPLQQAPALKSSRSVRMSMSAAVAELRRMNSQISVASGASLASSTTLPALRGGGFSPGKQGGSGGRNYLSLGLGLGLGLGNPPDKLPALPVVPPGSPPRGGTARRTRSRRGTVVFDAKMRRLDESARRAGSPGKTRFGGSKHAGQLLTHAARLRRQDPRRASVESLYDRQGFLK